MNTPNIDESWLAAMAYLETAKQRREAPAAWHAEEVEKQRQQDIKNIEIDIAWAEYLERDWEHS